MPPLRSDVGIAISDNGSGSSTPTSIYMPTEQPSSAPPTLRSSIPASAENTPSSARAALARQHQRAKTRRAFAVAPSGPIRPRSREVHDFVAPAHTSANSINNSTNSARSSVITPTPFPRRSTALDDAISRSRAASLSRPDSVRQTSEERASFLARQESTSQIDDPIQRTISPPLPYPITTIPSPRFAISSFAAQQFPSALPASIDRPPLTHADTAASGRTVYFEASEGRDPGAGQSSTAERPRFLHADTAASGRTVYTDASEGWDRSAAATPDEEEVSAADDQEFKVCSQPPDARTKLTDRAYSSALLATRIPNSVRYLSVSSLSSLSRLQLPSHWPCRVMLGLAWGTTWPDPVAESSGTRAELLASTQLSPHRPIYPTIKLSLV